MKTIETIYERRSVRRFLDKPVSEEEIKTLLNAGVQAPTATNSQPWVFSVMQGAQMLREVSDGAKAYLLANMDKIPNLKRYEKVLAKPQYNIFYNADSVIVIYAKPEGPHPEYDCCLAAQNIMLAAAEMGIGTCWIGFAGHYLDLQSSKEQFGIPATYKAVAPIILGYPKFSMPQLKKNPPQILSWVRDGSKVTT